MITTTESGPLRETEVEWSEARGFLRRCFLRQIHGIDDSDLEDLTQEASVRLIRAIRRGGTQELEALMNTIAQHTARDFLRRRYRWSVIFARTAADDVGAPDVRSPAPDTAGDPQGRIEFIVLQFFRRRSSSCLELAEAFFEDRDWPSVARQLGTTHDAVRARWSRCLSILRKAVATDPDCRLLAEWAGAC